MKTSTCPCHSKRKYAECCGPAHEGREPETPEALMRSRYAAFALGNAAYLAKTLASTHPDKKLSPRQVVSGLKFAGLRIVRAEGDEVHFRATIYDRGRDVSFEEISKFVREKGAWRYASGTILE